MRTRDEKKRAAILAAALAEVAASGLAALSIDAVAKRAHVATGTVYVYFSGKEALIEAAYVEVAVRLAEALAQNELRDGASPVRVCFERTCRAYFAYCTERPTEIAFLEHVELVPRYRRRIGALDRAAIAPLIALLERGQAERLVKRIAAPLLVAFLAGAIRFSATEVRGGTKATRARMATQLVTLCWDAIAA